MRSNKESKFGGEVKVTILPDVQNISNQKRGLLLLLLLLFFFSLLVYMCVWFLVLFVCFPPGNFNCRFSKLVVSELSNNFSKISDCVK